jgi:hypothetical protein
MIKNRNYLQVLLNQADAFEGGLCVERIITQGANNKNSEAANHPIGGVQPHFRIYKRCSRLAIISSSESP